MLLRVCMSVRVCALLYVILDPVVVAAQPGTQH